MRKGFFIACLLFLGIASCTPKETVYHEMEMLTESTHPIVKVALSPADTVGFLVDTGSDFTLVNDLYYQTRPDLFKGYYQEEVTIVTINGEEKREIESVSATLNGCMKIDMTVMDLTEMVQLLSTRHRVLVVGVLGSDFFDQYDAILDFENKKLITREYVKANK